MSRLRSDEGRSGPGHDPDILEDPVPDASGDHDGLPMPCRFWAIVAISFGTALVVIDGAIANVALPTIARELNVGEGAVTSVITIYRLVMVMDLLPFANLGDRIGLRKMYQIGQLMFCATSAPCFFAPSFSLLPLLRAGQALGAGMALAVAAALIREIYPSRSLGTRLGINAVIVASSHAIAPTIGGFLTEHLSWQMVFIVGAPIALVSLMPGRGVAEGYAPHGSQRLVEQHVECSHHRARHRRHPGRHAGPCDPEHRLGPRGRRPGLTSLTAAKRGGPRRRCRPTCWRTRRWASPRWPGSWYWSHRAR